MIARAKKYAYNIVVAVPALHWAWMKYSFIRKVRGKLATQLAFPTGRGAPKRSGRPRILMPQIETNHPHFYQMLILGRALQLRGADVKVLLCGSRLAGCEIKNVNNRTSTDPCLACRFNDQHVAGMLGLDTVHLADVVPPNDVSVIEGTAAGLAADYPSEFIYKGVNIIPIVNDSVIRFFYGAVPADPVQLRPVREQHLISAMIGLNAAESLGRTFAPEVLLNNMFVYSMAEPYYRYFGNAKTTRLSTVSITPVDYHSVILNIMDHFRSSERYYRYVKYRKGAHLTATESAVLGKRVADRTKGAIRMFKDQGYFDETANVKELLSIDEKKRNIFLFSNIYWDLATGETGQFGDILTWIYDTIDILNDRDDIHLYIKTHPGEKFDSAPSRKGIADFIREKYPVLPRHVTMVLPEMKVKPYDLFPYIDLGLVYSGTLGLEMLLCDIPVAAAGKAPFGGKGFAFEPATTEEYTKILLGDVPPLKPNKADVELFAYFYLIKNFVPWNLTKQVFGDVFDGYSFDSLADLLPGANPQLDHICNCILDPENTVIESWGDAPSSASVAAVR